MMAGICFVAGVTFAVDSSMSVTDDLTSSSPLSAADEASISLEAGTDPTAKQVLQVDEQAERDKARAAELAAKTLEAQRGKEEVEAVIGKGGRGVVGYRDFFYPLFHGTRLSYCTENHKVCGLRLASKYCELMGYHKATRIMIDHNVGVTRYPLTDRNCQGWRCDGFKLITCEESLKKTPIPEYYYRLKDFPVPRFDNYRVDWCYKTHRGCGRRAADAFCRQQGYRHANSYEKSTDALATRTIGSGALCFGQACTGFSRITCHR